MGSPQPTRDRDRSLELWIAYVLRAGVVTASGVILLGLIYGLISAQGMEEAVLSGVPGFRAPNPASLLQGLARGDPVAVVQLGLLLLILTPVARVAMTVVLFALQKDWVFVAIAATVLLLLTLELAGLVPL